MTQIAENYAWCIVQVTLFAAAALAVHGLLRHQSPDRNVRLLALSMATIGLMTFAFLSPWPRWGIVGEDVGSKTPAAEPTILFHASGTPGGAITGLGDKHVASPRPSPSLGDMPPHASHWRVNSDRPWWQLAIGAAWIGMAIGIARFLAGLAFVHCCRRQSMPIDDSQLLSEFSSLVHKLRITSPVKLVEIPTLAVAATIGWQRPLVILPANWRDWSTDQRRAVLAHELSHVVRRHFSTWFIGQLAVAAHFYHPLVHWLGHQLRLEQEFAADELAAHEFGDRHAYARTLAGLALGPQQPAPAYASLGLFMSRPLFMRRIAMLGQSKKALRSRSRVYSSFGPGLLSMIAIVAIGLRAAPNVAAEESITDTAAAPNSTPESAAPSDNAGSSATRPKTAPQAETPTSETPPDTAESPFATLFRSRSQQATALIHVSLQAPNKVSHVSTAELDKEWEIFCRTQLAYLHSHFVLQNAVERAGIGDLPLVKKQSDPVQWLIDELDVGFAQNSEILFLRLKGQPENIGQLRKIVDAVAESYVEIATSSLVDETRAIRETLSQNLERVNDDIRRKMEERNDLAHELEIAESDGRARVLQEIDMKRLERIDAELLRLEDEQLAAKIYNEQQSGGITAKELARLPYYEQRINELEKRQSDLEARIVARSQTSVELPLLDDDLRRLKTMANGFRESLESMESEPRQQIRIIQRAM
jgi:BlaR1 peptidase M56